MRGWNVLSAVLMGLVFFACSGSSPDDTGVDDVVEDAGKGKTDAGKKKKADAGAPKDEGDETADPPQTDNPPAKQQPPAEGPATCDSCKKQKCGSQITACTDDLSCVALASCIQKSDQSEAAINACGDQAPTNAQQEFVGLVKCIATNCGTLCK